MKYTIGRKNIFAIIIFCLLLLIIACNKSNNSPTAPPPPPPPPADPLNISWQIQYSGTLDLSLNVARYHIDLFDQSANVVSSLHANGSKVYCYINVGAWEEWRPDKNQFPDSVLGNDYEGWEGEKWLDIRKINTLAPIMRARFDQCQNKGFDGIEPDNIDGYTNNTGFPLTSQDQVNYNKWLAQEAHARGLTIGLKNDQDQVNALISFYDWAVTEDCFAEGWCNAVAPFISAGKPVFAIEYTDTGITLNQFCPQANSMNFNAILKHRNLDAYREACR